MSEPAPGRFRYSRWDGTQRLPELDADEVLDALSEDLLAEGDLETALRRLYRRGLTRPPDPDRPGMAGLRELLQRLADRRRELLERYQLGDVMADLREQLDEIVQAERRGLERRLAEAAEEGADPDLRRVLNDLAARRLEQLERLPEDVGERIRGL
ncbi:MAG: hypothetical protein ACXWPJ_03735 [Candidatus Limnocylindrales bacterium]